MCLVAFLAIGCSGTTRGEVQTPTQPNIVFIIADDMRADDYEYMPQTRQLLSEGGATFEEAFVTHSLCCPSRASILSPYPKTGIGGTVGAEKRSC